MLFGSGFGRSGEVLHSAGNFVSKGVLFFNCALALSGSRVIANCNSFITPRQLSIAFCAYLLNFKNNTILSSTTHCGPPPPTASQAACCILSSAWRSRIWGRSCPFRIWI